MALTSPTSCASPLSRTGIPGGASLVRIHPGGLPEAGSSITTWGNGAYEALMYFNESEMKYHLPLQLELEFKSSRAAGSPKRGGAVAQGSQLLRLRHRPGRRLRSYISIKYAC